MTMSERREYFGYTYTGPNGPPEALTPASRDLMIKQMAEQGAAKGRIRHVSRSRLGNFGFGQFWGLGNFGSG